MMQIVEVITTDGVPFYIYTTQEIATIKVQLLKDVQPIALTLEDDQGGVQDHSFTGVHLN